jgi:predicted nucleic acid-binding protein
VELADTSAWTNRHKNAAVEADFEIRLLVGEIATCPLVAMELLWTARTPSELRDLREWLAALPQVEIGPRVWEHAMDVWEALADEGRHREVKWVDLVIASAAEVAGVSICHYDRDFEAIAAVTGQAERPIAPLGTL